MNRIIPNPSLEIDVANLGPIEEAKIDLRPLTIFVGPSNTGKSYLTILIYALHRSIAGGSGDRFFDFDIYRSILGDSPRTISAQDASNLNNWMRRNLASNVVREAKSDSSLPESVASIIRPLLNGSDQTRQVIQREISRCFGIEKIGALIRHGNDQSRVIIRKNFASNSKESLNKFGYFLRFDCNDKLTLTPTISPNFPIRTSFYDNELGNIRDEYGMISRGFQQDPSKADLQTIFHRLINRLAAGIITKILDPLHRTAHYFPADRTGIMHANRLVTSALLEYAALDGSRLPSSGRMLRGVLVDFLKELIRINPYQGMGSLGELDTHQGGECPLFRENNYAILKWIEEQILGGRIQVDRTQFGHPSFAFRPSKSDQELPLVHASSMVSELAPVVLCLQQTVREGDVLIVEEPESHLHPGAQTAFARVLARIVRAGVRVITTTHSDWFVEQIGNLMRISDLPEPHRGQIPGIDDSDELLDSNDVGVWLFNPPKNSTQGAKVDEIKLHAESGRFEIDYDAVREELYDQSATIYNRIQRAKESRIS